MDREEKVKPATWYVDQKALARIGSLFGLRLFMHLWEVADPQSLTIEEELPKELTSEVSRQTLWRAFSGLESIGLIRRSSGSKSWSTIYINPAMVHPYWVKGGLLDSKIAFFNEKASVRFVVKGEPKVGE